MLARCLTIFILIGGAIGLSILGDNLIEYIAAGVFALLSLSYLIPVKETKASNADSASPAGSTSDARASGEPWVFLTILLVAVTLAAIYYEESVFAGLATALIYMFLFAPLVPDKPAKSDGASKSAVREPRWRRALLYSAFALALSFAGTKAFFEFYSAGATRYWLYGASHELRPRTVEGATMWLRENGFEASFDARTAVVSGVRQVQGEGFMRHAQWLIVDVQFAPGTFEFRGAEARTMPR